MASVIDLRRRPDKTGNSSGGGKDGWYRRQAVQVVAMLPDDGDEARAVLEWAALIVGFLERPT